MLDKIKLLLSKADDDTIDELLSMLITLCKEEAYTYCNLPQYDEKLDFIVIQMVIERYNRMGSEGMSSQKFSGISAEYNDFYSAKVRRFLNKHRKVRTI